MVEAAWEAMADTEVPPALMRQSQAGSRSGCRLQKRCTGDG